MMILLTGGSGNGKSTLAVKLLSGMPAPHYLIDTALVYDESEAGLRREKQTQLKNRGMETISCGTGLDSVYLPAGSSAVLECMCHLTANEMFQAHTIFDVSTDFETTFSRILKGIANLKKQCENLIIVTNEVSCDGLNYDESTKAYQQMLGRLNMTLAAESDCVCEVVCGLPVALKGQLPEYKTISEEKMNHILVIGPENAGKREYVKSLGYQEYEMSNDVYSDCPVLLDLQKAVLNNPDLQSLMPHLLQKKVIVCNEVGSGIIPVSPDLTNARVQTGKLCSELAQCASRVVRVICGIPIILK